MISLAVHYRGNNGSPEPNARYPVGRTKDSSTLRPSLLVLGLTPEPNSLSVVNRDSQQIMDSSVFQNRSSALRDRSLGSLRHTLPIGEQVSSA